MLIRTANKLSCLINTAQWTEDKTWVLIEVVAHLLLLLCVLHDVETCCHLVNLLLRQSLSASVLSSYVTDRLIVRLHHLDFLLLDIAIDIDDTRLAIWNHVRIAGNTLTHGIVL